MPSPHRQNSQTQSEVSPESRGTLTPLPLRPDVRNRWAQPGPAPTIPGAEPGEGALGSYLRAVRSHLVLVIAITVAAGMQEVFEVATVQNLYNLSHRDHEDVLAYREGQGIGFIPWFPLAAGT